MGYKAPPGIHHPRFIDITGKTFTDWEVLEFSHSTSIGAYFLCRCACGTEKPVPSRSLRNGESRGCGCKKIERLSKSKTRHGHAGRKSADHTGTYISWRGMLSRVRAAARGVEKYRAYRGIKVCPRWDHRQGGSFENFLEDMGWRPLGKTLDRISPFGNYEPENCTWSTPMEQARNRRSALKYRDKESS